MGLKPGTSAVTAITSRAFLKAVQKHVAVEDIREFVSNLASEIYSRLNEGKSVAIGILLAKTGLAFKEVAVGKNTAEVIGLAITDKAVVAGAMEATDERINYKIAGATVEGAVVEAGVITKEGALIVDNVITHEGEALVATAILPESTTGTPAKEDKPADAGEKKEKADKK
jgi:hypothetical protein